MADEDAFLDTELSARNTATCQGVVWRVHGLALPCSDGAACDTRCGPMFGNRTCADYCNETSGWCGSSTDHRDAQASNVFNESRLWDCALVLNLDRQPERMRRTQAACDRAGIVQPPPSPSPPLALPPLPSLPSTGVEL